MSSPETDRTADATTVNDSTYDAFNCSKGWEKHRSKEYFEYRKQWEAPPAQKLSLTFPIHLDIETTNICNLLCPMCPRTVMVAANDPTYTEPGRITREEYASIIDQGAEHGLKSIKLNYLSEPLAHKDICWQIEYAKKKGILDVMINTNAALLRPEISKGLLEAGLDNLFVSIDAISPDLFEQQRVGTSLGRVIDHLHAFVKLRDAGYPHVQIRVSMVMYDDPKWKEQYEGLKIMWKSLVDAIGFTYYSEGNKINQTEYPEVPGFVCYQPFERLSLKYSGAITMCCIDYHNEINVGDWRKQKLYDVWNGEEHKRLRRTHLDGRYYELDLCRKCYLPSGGH